MCIRDSKRTGNGYGPCSAICPISFRLITFEIRRIARKADHSRDHQGCANKYCFSSFPFSATLKSSKFQVVQGISIAKSAIVSKTTNTSRNIVPFEKEKNRSPAYRRKESFGHLYFDTCWMENLKDWNINDVPGSVFCLFLLHFLFCNKSVYQITCRTPTAVEIRCLNSPVMILPFKTLKYHYSWLPGIWKQRCREYSPFFFSPETPAPKNNRFRGIMLLRIRSVMYTRRNMYLGAGENMWWKNLNELYE